MNVYEQAKPFQSNAERLVSEALASSQAPESLLAGLRPPLPQIDPFPPRLGYPSYQDRQTTVRAVLGFHRLYPDARTEVSGGAAGYQASSRNVQSDGSW